MNVNVAQLSTVLVQEKSAYDVALPAQADTNVIERVQSIHATIIHVVAQSSVAGDLKLRLYSANGQLSELVTLGTLSAATTASFTYGDTHNKAIGQRYDVVFEPGSTPSSDTITAWTAARA